MFSKGSSDKSEPTTVTAPKPAPAKSNAMPSIVSAGLQITGNMVSDGDMQIEGSIEGDVRSRVLTVGENGSISGKVEADQAYISGTVKGQIVARSLTLSKSARIDGDISHETICIEAGAMVEGHLKYLGKARSTVSDTFESVKKQIKDVGPSSGDSASSDAAAAGEAKSAAGQKV